MQWWDVFNFDYFVIAESTLSFFNFLIIAPFIVLYYDKTQIETADDIIK